MNLYLLFLKKMLKELEKQNYALEAKYLCLAETWQKMSQSEREEYAKE